MASLGDMGAMFKGDPSTCFENFIIVNNHINTVFDVLKTVKKALRIEREYDDAFRAYQAVVPPSPDGSSLLSGNVPIDFVDKYKSFKSSRPVVNMIKAFTCLEARREYILKKNIMADIQGVSFIPFAEDFPSFDLNNYDSDDSVVLINEVMFMLYGNLKIMYVDGIRKRDIDTEIITKALLAGIQEMQKTMPRHGKTFSFIQKHSEILKDTINEHYIDYESSEGNSTVILSAYFKKLKDISGDDISLRAGLRDIVAEIRKRVASNQEYFNNPQIKMALDILNEFDL